MKNFLPYNLNGNRLLLTANRTIFWEDKETLVLSDLHLGKSGHFRKAGIGVPQSVFKEDMQRLLSEIQIYNAKQLIIVGDLFHSRENKEHEMFLRWRNDLPGVNIHLVLGNHDILKKEWYLGAGIELHENVLKLKNLLFTHDINNCNHLEDNSYCISGHIHPGISLHGLGRQSLRFPCFYFGKKYAVLPAFGRFTGTFPVKPVSGDAVFALVENKIMQLQ
ncbi:MAG: ligase-associated DNA damage response endonuclease PdeM [Ferruginibacter sp.]